MSQPLSMIVVGHHFMAGIQAVKLLHEGHHVIWIKHRPIPPRRIVQGIEFDRVAPFFHRSVKKTDGPSAPAVKLIWDRHRLSLEKRIWSFELFREFGETQPDRWNHPQSIVGTHHAKQCSEALTRYLSLHSSTLREAHSPLQSVLEWSTHDRGLTAHETLQNFEDQVVSLGGQVLDTCVTDLVVERGRVWGVVVDDFIGTLPAREVYLMDHLLSFSHLELAPLKHMIQSQFPVHSRRFTFNFAIPRKDLPEELGSEAILFSHPDYPVIAPHALYLEVKSPPSSDICVIAVRQDCPLLKMPLHSNHARDLMRQALRRIERTLCPFLYHSLEALDPALDEPVIEAVPLENEWCMNLNFTPRENRPVPVADHCLWYGPEAWGSLGWFAQAAPLPFPRIDMEQREASV